LNRKAPQLSRREAVDRERAAGSIRGERAVATRALSVQGTTVATGDREVDTGPRSTWTRRWRASVARDETRSRSIALASRAIATLRRLDARSIEGSSVSR
jgi:hypothetical protein